MHAAAEGAGRDPESIEVGTTIERALPETDEESEQFVQAIQAKIALGISHFVMDFGNPETTEPVLRFAEQVIAPLRAG